VPEHVAALVKARLVRIHGEVHVHERLERLVVHLDQLGRPPRGLGMVGRDDRDRLALVADDVDREHRLVRDLEPVGLAAGNVIVRLDRVDAPERERLAEVDRADARVRMRAPERGPPQHPVGPEVRGVGELALHLQGPVGPVDALADAVPDGRAYRVRAGAAHAIRASAAERTASRIFS
jgi:hypothetical protein